jgi:hypothetical protein
MTGVWADRLYWLKMSENYSSEGDMAPCPMIDRRTGEDRRKAVNPDFFARGGIERRSGIEVRGSSCRGMIASGPIRPSGRRPRILASALADPLNSEPLSLRLGQVSRRLDKKNTKAKTVI